MASVHLGIILKFSVAITVFTSSVVYAAQVVSFYPTGSVKQVQQTTVRFSAEGIGFY
ncbi:MAG: hypothetical protein L6Q37_07280 [Bdellovibrionaceae bacterium]|nr:hypothetical protein [Pseudobdellovibrionaceae bacterium]NUM59126.1 hypothetical protein [Pseudobdellovibrionaceae bacterium]